MSKKWGRRILRWLDKKVRNALGVQIVSQHREGHMGNTDWLIIGEDPERMNSEIIAGHRLYRPRLSAEVDVRVRAEEHLRATYAPGVYTARDDVNAILQRQFAFHGAMLETELEKIASRHFMEFVLHQYDISCAIEHAARSLPSGQPDLVRWLELGPMFRRTAKYLAERITLLAPEEAPKAPKSEQLGHMDVAWICSEEIIRLYNLSSQTHSLFPDETRLEIRPPGELEYFRLTIEKGQIVQLQERMRVDTANRDRFVPNGQFLFDVAAHDAILGPPMKATLGIGYKDALSVLHKLNDAAIPPDRGFPIPFSHYERTVEACLGLGFSKESIEAVLAGFTITKEKMLAEDRVVWKPKQEYRAYRRAFFEFPHPTGPHLTWSKEMAKESLVILLGEVIFKQFPHEWKSPDVLKGIEKISNQAGKWFESVCAENLVKCGFAGIRSFKDAIGLGSARLEIPKEVGELDGLGYSPAEELLLVAEYKLVRSGSETAFFRDDLSKFVQAKGSYTEQLQKKEAWVRANLPAVCNALGAYKNFSAKPNPKKIAHALITFYPNIASYLIEDFPCVSLTELMMAYEASGKWPYEHGATDA